MLGANVPTDALGASARRYQPDVICLSSTVASPAGEVMRAIGEVHQQWPAAGFVVGGRGLLCRVRSRSGIDVFKRVSDVVEAVDAMVKRASLN
jgi:hypothetical protein